MKLALSNLVDYSVGKVSSNVHYVAFTFYSVRKIIVLCGAYDVRITRMRNSGWRSGSHAHLIVLCDISEN